MMSLSSPDSFVKEMESHKTKVMNELGVAVYGDLGNLFRRENPSVAGIYAQKDIKRELEVVMCPVNVVTAQLVLGVSS